MSPESFAYRSYTRSFKGKFSVFSTWIRGFQVKGTLKALCQEGLILNPLNFCRFLFKKKVMMSKSCTQMRLEGTSFHASLGRTGMKKRASFKTFVRQIRTTVRK